MNIDFEFVDLGMTDEGIVLLLHATDPAQSGALAGLPDHYSVFVTHAEVDALANAVQFRNLVLDKIDQKMGNNARLTKLQGFIGGVATQDVDPNLMRRSDAERPRGSLRI